MIHTVWPSGRETWEPFTLPNNGCEYSIELTQCGTYIACDRYGTRVCDSLEAAKSALKAMVEDDLEYLSGKLANAQRALEVL